MVDTDRSLFRAIADLCAGLLIVLALIAIGVAFFDALLAETARQISALPAAR